MRFVLFYHSLISDWNNGHAHFLRGIVRELQERGHTVDVYEPHDGWSLENLREDGGPEAIREFERAFPTLRSRFFDVETFDPETELAGADVVLVHEWNDPDLVARIGAHRARVGGYRLFFHDTHHRSVTKPEQLDVYDLSQYDGVLAFGRIIRDLYLEEGWADRAWVWHEAADTRTFRPLETARREGDLVWIGNFGDDERSDELRQYLLEPVRTLGIKARVYGVRYPEVGVQELNSAGIEAAGRVPNHRVPEVFSRFRVTLHVPRRPYRESIPGIPTIRVFEALACGIPLVSAPWEDIDGLFRPGTDFLVAQTGEEMTEHIRNILEDPGLAAQLARNGRQTILDRHTCAHRVDELFQILEDRKGSQAQGLHSAGSETNGARQQAAQTRAE